MRLLGFNPPPGDVPGVWDGRDGMGYDGAAAWMQGALLGGRAGGGHRSLMSSTNLDGGYDDDIAFSGLDFLKALLIGFISAVSLTIGSCLGVYWMPSQNLAGVMAAFGGGALLAALSVVLVAPTVLAVSQQHEGGAGAARADLIVLLVGMIVGGFVFVFLDQMVTRNGGEIKKFAQVTKMKVTKRAKDRRKDILQTVEASPIFKKVPADLQEDFVKDLNAVQYHKGEVLFYKGSLGNKLFFLQKGTVALQTVPGHTHSDASDGELLGQIALLTSQPHFSTAIAETEVRALVIRREDMLEILQRSRKLERALLKSCYRRLNNFSVADAREFYMRGVARDRLKEEMASLLENLREEKLHSLPDSERERLQKKREEKAAKRAAEGPGKHVGAGEPRMLTMTTSFKGFDAASPKPAGMPLTTTLGEAREGRDSVESKDSEYEKLFSDQIHSLEADVLHHESVVMEEVLRHEERQFEEALHDAGLGQEVDQSMTGSSMNGGVPGTPRSTTDSAHVNRSFGNLSDVISGNDPDTPSRSETHSEAGPGGGGTREYLERRVVSHAESSRGDAEHNSGSFAAIQSSIRNIDLESLTRAESGWGIGGTETKPLAVWLGILLDGLPESIVIGVHFHDKLAEEAALGDANPSFSKVIPYTLIAGLFLSNFPEALSSSMAMFKYGWSRQRTVFLWTTIGVITSLGSGIGYAVASKLHHRVLLLIQGIAAGAMLTMIASAMIPEAVHLCGPNKTGISILCGFIAATLFELLNS